MRMRRWCLATAFACCAFPAAVRGHDPAPNGNGNPPGPGPNSRHEHAPWADLNGDGEVNELEQALARKRHEQLLKHQRMKKAARQQDQLQLDEKRRAKEQLGPRPGTNHPDPHAMKPPAHRANGNPANKPPRSGHTGHR